MTQHPEKDLNRLTFQNVWLPQYSEKLDPGCRLGCVPVAFGCLPEYLTDLRFEYLQIQIHSYPHQMYLRYHTVTQMCCTGRYHRYCNADTPQPWVCYKTYLPVGTNFGGWYVLREN